MTRVCIKILFVALLTMVATPTPFLYPLFGQEGQYLRVGGNYVVKKITKVEQPNHEFEVSFESTDKTGKFDRLILKSNHVHFGVKEGDVLRISADVKLSKPKGESEIDQVVLYLPGPHSEIFPVWMVSSKSNPARIGGSKLLEMHNPHSDYTIF